MRRKLIIANWKMHLNVSQASLLLHRLHERIKIHREIEVVLAPGAIHLQPLSLQIDRRKFRLAAQNAYHQDLGAYTGEISFTQLHDLVHYCLIGHSERRHIFHESLDEITAKVAAAVRNEVTPILCVGETAHEKHAGEMKRVIHDQLITGLRNLTSKEVKDMVIAYEPVWAIGTGDVATPDYAQKVAEYIRHNITELYGPKTAKLVRVLYGGSVNAAVAKGFLDTPGIDGLLVGGASLNYAEFAGIVDAAYRSLYSGDQQ